MDERREEGGKGNLLNEMQSDKQDKVDSSKLKDPLDVRFRKRYFYSNFFYKTVLFIYLLYQSNAIQYNVGTVRSDLLGAVQNVNKVIQ